jgi:tetrahydromethanopterin S-methyltransferase subunit G
MDAIFFILFGMVAGMILLPHLQRLADQFRRRLDELDRLDKTKGPSPWS